MVHRPPGCRLPAAFAMRKRIAFWNGAFWNRRALSFQAKSHLKGSVVWAEISGPLGSYGLMGHLKLTTL